MLRNVPEEYVLDEKVIRHYKPVSNKKDIIGDIKYIRSFMKKDPGAVFISFFTYQSFYTILAAFGTKAEVIVSERNDPSKTVKGKVDNFIRNILYKCKLCKKIVFQTTGAKEYFDQAIQGKGEIILNPLKKEVENIQWNPEYKEIVAVGRLTEQKNYPMLIESFAQFANLYPDYKLRIFGQGELEGQLLKLASRMNVENKVVFEGFCSNVHQQIKSAGMFVMSSDYEGLSNALLEAMAIGLPCISTDSPPGGARMVIESGVNGILVPVGDIASMTKAMKKLLTILNWHMNWGIMRKR